MVEQQAYQRVKNHPKFAELVAKRSRFALILSVIMLVIYYGFILVIAFVPEVLGIRLGPDTVTTVGIPVGILIILSAITLTGIYARRANSEFDALNEQILEDSK
jgi:uncharacterized membrane protein (DUF485 family)